MKNRALIPLAIGLVVGLIAVKYSVDVVKKARAAGGEDMLQVVIAQETIPMGVEIKPNMLSVSKAVRALAPQGSFEEPVKLKGRVARSQIPKGVPVIEEMLAAPGTPAGMASLVPAGYRAVAVRVDEFTSVGGFIKPGCRVDVAAVMNVRTDKGSETISRVILQDVTVGAVGQSLTGEGDTSAANISRSVTLLVKPEEVPVLNLAATQGQIRLALRHFSDGVSNSNNYATDEQLAPDRPKEKGSFFSGLMKLIQHGSQETSAPKPDWANRPPEESKAVPVSTTHVMTVISGNTAQTIAFQSPDSAVRVNVEGQMQASAAMAMATEDPAHGAAAAQTASSGDVAPSGAAGSQNAKTAPQRGQ